MFSFACSIIQDNAWLVTIFQYTQVSWIFSILLILVPNIDFKGEEYPCVESYPEYGCAGQSSQGAQPGHLWSRRPAMWLLDHILVPGVSRSLACSALWGHAVLPTGPAELRCDRDGIPWGRSVGKERHNESKEEVKKNQGEPSGSPLKTQRIYILQ